jgi:WXG100 family type VII secretion target
MPNVNVTYQDMRTAASDLRRGKIDITDDLQLLKAKVDDLVRNGYVTDTSSRQFDTSYTDFDTGVRQVLDGLEGMAAYLDRAAQTFEDADTSLAGQMG